MLTHLSSLSYITGTCSDSLVTLQLDPTQGSIRYGVCGVPYNPSALSTIPACTYPYQFCPMGCCDYSVYNPTDCTEEGGTWYAPGSSKATCEANQGCYEVDTNVLTETVFLHSFSQKNQENCNACGQTYKKWFEWTPATYLTGSYVAVETVETSYGSRFSWTEALDFNALFEMMLNGSNNQVLLVGKSGTLCQYVHFFFFFFFFLFFPFSLFVFLSHSHNVIFHHSICAIVLI